MADTKISGLAALGAAPATGDLFVLVDISDTSMALTGTDKKMTVANLFTSPTLVTPTIGVATATTVNKITLTQPAGGATLTIVDGKVVTFSKTLSFTGTDSTTMTFPATSATIARTDAANTFTGHQTIEGVTSTGATGTNLLVFATSPTLTTPIIGVATGTSLAVTGLLKSSGTAGVGYATGAGGTVGQLTSKSTGVTLDKTTGTITLDAEALAGVTAVTFTLTNSTIAATDVVVLSHKSGGTAGSYLLSVSGVAAGSCGITVYNNTAAPLSEAVVLSFAVIKGVAA